MQTTCGTTTFEHDEDYTGKVRIQTSEGSTVAVPAEDLFKFASIYARQQRMVELDRMTWQEVLAGSSQRRG